jgi:hypothetical protein
MAIHARLKVVNLYDPLATTHHRPMHYLTILTFSAAAVLSAPIPPPASPATQSDTPGPFLLLQLSLAPSASTLLLVCLMSPSPRLLSNDVI